jgi:hypothetical protein
MLRDYATSANFQNNRILNEAQMVPEDGDFFATQSQADEIELLADTIVDAVAIPGDKFNTVERYKDLTKIEMPGLIGSLLGFDWQVDMPWTNNGTEQVIGRMKVRSKTVRGLQNTERDAGRFDAGWVGRELIPL